MEVVNEAAILPRESPSKRDEIAARAEEKKRQVTENCTFQPTLLARQSKANQIPVSNGGSRFDRLYDDAMKRQSSDPKPKIESNTVRRPNSALKLRSSSVDTRADENSGCARKSANFDKNFVKEPSKEPSNTVNPKRPNPAFRSPSVSAMTARQNVAKISQNNGGDENKGTSLKSPNLIKPTSQTVTSTVPANGMIFMENPMNARSTSAIHRKRLDAENLKSQDNENGHVDDEGLEGLTPRANGTTQIDAPAVSVAARVNSERGRDKVVKEVSGSRFDTLYKDAKKRKDSEPALKAKNEVAATFKPVISHKARSISRDRPTGDQVDRLNNASGAGRTSSKAAPNDTNSCKPTISKRANSLDRENVNISNRLNALKGRKGDQVERPKQEVQTKELGKRTFKPDLSSSNKPSAIQLSMLDMSVTSTESVGDRLHEYGKEKMRKKRDDVNKDSEEKVPDICTSPTGSDSPKKIKTVPFSPTELHFDHIFNAAVKRAEEVSHVPSKRVSSVKTNGRTSTPNSRVRTSADRAGTPSNRPSTPNSRISTPNNHISTPRSRNVEPSRERPKRSLEVNKTPTPDSSSKTRGTSPKPTPPFQSPGMRARSSSTDNRRWSVTSNGTSNGSDNGSNLYPLTSASISSRISDTKLEEIKRIKAEEECIRARIKAQKAERSSSSSNVLKGGTAFAMPPSMDDVSYADGELTPPPSCTPDVAASPARSESAIRRSADLTPPSQPGMPFGRCV